jgi:hypothetical protein
MNAAFRKSEAFARLENYAEVIVLHLTLIVCYPKAQEVKYWEIELEAFKGVLQRYNKSKTKKDNFNSDDIIDALTSIIDSNEGRDYIANDIMGARKGYAIDSHDIDWNQVEQAIKTFSKNVLR